MELSGDHRIPAPRDQVWAALKSPDMLRHSLPGCKSIRQAKRTVTATITIALDGLARPFTGRVILTGFDGQDSGLLVIEGSHSFKSFGPRNIEVRLSALDDGATLLSYRADIRADADDGGAADSPVILDAARRLGADFVERLGTLFTAAPAEPPVEPSGTPAEPPVPPAEPPVSDEPLHLPTQAPHSADEIGQAESALLPLEQEAPLDAPVDAPDGIGPDGIDLDGISDAQTASPLETAQADAAASTIDAATTRGAPPPGLRPMVWIPILVLALLLLIVLIR